MKLPEIIAAAAKLRVQIKRSESVLEKRKAKLAPLEEQIIEAGRRAAQPTESGGARADLPGVIVSFPRPSLKLTADSMAAARKAAGSAWSQLTEAVAVPFALVKSAREIAAAVLTEAAAKKFFSALEKENAPRLTYK